MKLDRLFLFGLFVAVCVPPTDARLIEVWSYDQYVAASDLVAVVEPVQNHPASDRFPDAPSRYHLGDFEATDTLFKVHTTFKAKGNPPQSLTVLHFSYSKQATNTMNGGLFIQFPVENRTAKSAFGPDARLEGKKYLAFLKKRSDERFEPVRGQYDARLAFRELREPGPQGD